MGRTPMPHDHQLERTQPVQVVDTGSAHDDPRTPSERIALCLSGGGYRAMLFHLGALWRLNEVGYLPKLSRISSVSVVFVLAMFDIMSAVRNVSTKSTDQAAGRQLGVTQDLFG
jgi:hypothetical protein